MYRRGDNDDDFNKVTRTFFGRLLISSPAILSLITFLLGIIFGPHTAEVFISIVLYGLTGVCVIFLFVAFLTWLIFG
jgi:hypothetical protein